MGFYARVVFPRLCDWALARPAVARERQTLLAHARGEVLEIGFGTGLNLPHYPPAVRRLVALDPNPGMHALARRHAKHTSLAVEHIEQRGEALPFGDATFDCVVSTFTLCSVADVATTLAEAARVLRPGGRFLVLEHGLSPDASVARWQRRLNGLEQRLADGCRLDRDMRALVAQQPGWSLDADAFYLRGVPWTHGYVTRGQGLRIED